jgi:hypothetical protein
MMLMEVIQKIMRFRKQGDQQKALDEIRYFYDCLKVDGNLNELTVEELFNLLVDKNKLSNEQLEMVAFVLKEQGELEKIETKKLDFFRKAYFLLEKTDRESTSFSMERQLKLAELRVYLN